MPKSLELHYIAHSLVFPKYVVILNLFLDVLLLTSLSLSFFFGIDINKKGGFSSSCLLSNI